MGRKIRVSYLKKEAEGDVALCKAPDQTKLLVFESSNFECRFYSSFLEGT
jgi:hypothetical protein